jgi:hypothetical protein
MYGVCILRPDQHVQREGSEEVQSSRSHLGTQYMHVLVAVLHTHDAFCISSNAFSCPFPSLLYSRGSEVTS